MEIPGFLPASFSWEKIPAEKIQGETGFARIKKIAMGDIQIRHVEYSENYLADHWCEKGHIVLVTHGKLILVHSDDTIIEANAGMTYLVGDNSMPHRARSVTGATVIIVD